MKIRKFFFNLFHWESWHYHVKYIPIAPAWIWYCLRAKSFWFFTASNPTITFGGFEGEGKAEIYKQLPEESYPFSILIKNGTSFNEVERLLNSSHLDYPLVVKPDEGMMGYMFRRIENHDQLEHYHEKIPFNYIIQEWVDYPLEVSIFYSRMPDAEKGKVSGFLMKKMPEVMGDGESSLLELIESNPDLKYQLNDIMNRHRSRLTIVIPRDEIFILSHASNRSQGAKLIGLSHEIDERLVAMMDKISLSAKYFYYGRYDIKCASIEKLKEGKEFKILEYNGAGAGIQHIYGNGLNLWEACSTILAHWQDLFRISIYNHQSKGIRFWDYKSGAQFLKNARQNLTVLKRLDKEFPA